MLAACSLLTPDAPEPFELLDGPIAGLNHAQTALFLRGDDEFTRRFTAATGLGPVFNASSCDACHPGDGRAHPELGFTRFGRALPDGGFDPLHALGGPQLQDRAIPGYTPEALPAAATATSTFLAPAVTGLGLLDAVEDATLLALEDPDDLDGDGISGRVHRVPDSPALQRIAALNPRVKLHDGRYIGRFGRKGGNLDLLHQTATAYNQDMGLTSTLAPDEPRVGGAGGAGDLAGELEVSADTLDAVTFYLRTLRPPERRDADAPDVLAGEARFEQLGCAACHVPALTTGDSPISPLHRKTAYAYTDLLLHDMGPELDDGYAEGDATSAEWRTPPLWGLGLAATTQGGRAFYMHDGRATTLTAAIELHGGEAAASRSAFRALSADERAQLLQFLESL